MKTFKFEFVKLSLIWRCTNGPHAISNKKSISIPFFENEWIELISFAAADAAEAGRLAWLLCFSLFVG